MSYITTITVPAGQINKPYSFCFELDKTFDLCASNLPAGLTAKKVGNSICIGGTPTISITGFDLRVAVTLCCGSLQTFKSELTIL